MYFYDPSEFQSIAISNQKFETSLEFEILDFLSSLKTPVLQIFPNRFEVLFIYSCKVFERESCLSKSRNLSSGWHDLWWSNVCGCWTRSSQIEWTFMYVFQPSLWNLGLRDIFLKLWIYEHWFLRLQTRCKTWSETLRIPMRLSVTFISISWNFWHPSVNALASSALQNIFL